MFKKWVHPKTGKVRVYFKPEYRHSIKAWYEADGDGLAEFHFEDPGAMPYDADPDAVRREIEAEAKSALAGLLGRPANGVSFLELADHAQAPPGPPRTRAKRTQRGRGVSRSS